MASSRMTCVTVTERRALLDLMPRANVATIRKKTLSILWWHAIAWRMLALPLLLKLLPLFLKFYPVGARTQRNSASSCWACTGLMTPRFNPFASHSCLNWKLSVPSSCFWLLVMCTCVMDVFRLAQPKSRIPHYQAQGIAWCTPYTRPFPSQWVGSGICVCSLSGYTIHKNIGLVTSYTRRKFLCQKCIYV